MNIASLKSAAVLAGVGIVGGAALGGGAGAVRALRQEPSGDGISTMERRNAVANAILGGGAGAIGGAALLGLGKLIRIAPLQGLPVAAMLGLGLATGAASVGAYSLASAQLD